MSDDELTDRLAALAARVDALEAAAGLASGAPEPPLPGRIDTELLDRLQARSGPPFEAAGPHGTAVRGSVLYAGAAEVGGGSYVWQMERPVPGLLGTDDDQLAHALAAIASPTRIRLLKAILAGAHETQQLQSALGGVSTGQLYHHLKELTAVGFVVQRARGRYEIAAHAVVPVLAVIAAVHDLTTKGN